MAQRSRLRWKSVVLVSVLAPLLVGVFLSAIVYLRAVMVARPQAGSRTLSIPETPGLNLSDHEMWESVNRYVGGIKIATVSYDVNKQESQALLDLMNYLQDNFPLVHNSSFVRRSVINEFSLLYEVRGAEDTGKMPYLLAAHLDVVPAEEAAWDVHPFSGAIINQTYIYGRGTIDFKLGVFGIMEALEHMLANKQRPKRDFYIAFGHDEEVMGTNGAKSIAKELRRRGITELDFLVDEGIPIVNNMLPGVDHPVSILGVTEKGYVTVELSVTQETGHSSSPPFHTSIGILAAAITRLEDNQIPSKFGEGPEAEMFSTLAKHMPLVHRVIFSNLWLFSPLVSYAMASDQKFNAFLRTTTAVTVIQGGSKENVVPGNARALVNHRIHPSQTVAEVVEIDRRNINDPRVKLTVQDSREPLAVSPCGPSDLAYQLVSASIRQTFADVIVAPGVVIGNTDTRWYEKYTRNIYRLMPVILNGPDISRIHGNNERITIDDYRNAIDFYYRLIRNADAAMFLEHSHASDEL